MSAPSFQAVNPNFETDVRASFAKQGIMSLIGASMPTVEPGYCVVELPFHASLSQQDGFFHAGATSTIADSAGGYAALTLMPPGARVLTVEFKINLLAPAAGDRLRAEGLVAQAGRKLTVVTINVHCVSQENTRLCALMQQTAIAIPSNG